MISYVLYDLDGGVWLFEGYGAREVVSGGRGGRRWLVVAFKGDIAWAEEQ